MFWTIDDECRIDEWQFGFFFWTCLVLDVEKKITLFCNAISFYIEDECHQK